MKKKYLPLDVSSFQTMISGNYLYIDKTKYIYDLFSKGNRYYFLSRPRRFGKSLLISTLKELFLGNKKIFEQLWIDSSDYEWQEYPIIDLDFSRIAHRTVEELEKSLTWTLSQIGEKYGVDISKAPTLPDKLTDLIQKLSHKNKVVVLVDEYDKPILDHIQNVEAAQAQRDLLKSFYDPLKSLDAYLRAIFVTGVTKFSKTSLFSGMNNLNDISLKPETAQLLGYTQEEIDKYFSGYVQDFVHQKDRTAQKIMDELKQWYNGYRFSSEKIYVYNPFSVLYCLQDKNFANYWFQSGTPTFLIHLIKNQYSSIEDIEQLEIDQDSLNNFEINNIPLIPLLFQAGYLTIGEYLEYPSEKKTSKYKLSFPNFEVELSFTKFLVATLTQTSSTVLNDFGPKLTKALNENDIETFCVLLQSLFAHIPYNLIYREDYYHVLFQFLLSLLSLEAQSELHTNRGRIDLVVCTSSYIYIFELKLNTTPEAALAQIKERGYYERFLHKGKPVILVGLAFTPKEEGLRLRCAQEIL